MILPASAFPMMSSPVIAGLLLDVYPSAAAAYSLRRLRTAYSGSCIRVRRSSDNTEQDIGFVGNALDTATLLSFCGAGDGFVTRWYDQSGNANNATQPSTANQPRIVVTGALHQQNGKPSILFNGSSSVLNLTSSITTNNICSAFTVSNPTSSLNVNSALLAGNTGSLTFRYRGAGGSQISAEVIKTFVVNLLVGANVSSALKQTAWLTNDTTATVLQNNVNNGSAAMQSITNPLTHLGFSPAGFTHWFNGGVSEVIIYTTNQSTNASAINLDQIAYYGIT